MTAVLDSEATVVGRIPGAFAVDASGAATYSIPINVAPGINGLRPDLSLVYSSLGGDGVLGAGWGLGGMSAISRCNKTIDTNGQRDNLKGDSNDQFCIDGQPLVRDSANPSGAAYGANGTLYRTEIDTYDRIISYGSLNGGPEYFLVKKQSGLSYIYGKTADSLIAGTYSNAPTRAWQLSQIQDKYFNSIRYTYKPATEGWNPATITWTDHCSSQQLPCAAGTGNRYSIAFDYENRPDSRSGYDMLGANWTRSKRLNKITYKLDGALVHDYTIAYTTPPSTGSGRSQVASITLCGDQTTLENGCFAATSIQWQNSIAGYGPLVYPGIPGAHLVVGYGDFDGDGRTDLVTTLSGAAKVWRATGSGFQDTSAQLAYTEKAVIADFTGDGMDDVLAYNAGQQRWVLQIAPDSLPGGQFQAVTTDLGASVSDPAALDFNGDGLADLVFVLGQSVYTQTNVGCNFVTIANCISPAPQYAPSLTLSSYGLPVKVKWNAVPTSGRAQAADFNADGRDDIIIDYLVNGTLHKGFAFSYSGNHLGNNGQNTWDLVGSTGTTDNAVLTITLDINGDGLSDIAYFRDDGTPGWSTMLNLGAGFAPPQFVSGTGFNAVNSFFGVPVDYNNDGLDDLITSYSVKPDRVLLSDGTGFSTAAGRTATISTIAGSASNYEISAVDVTGDGFQDLVYRTSGYGGPGCCGPSWYQNVHLGPKGDLVTSITDGLGNAVSGVTYKPLTDSTVYVADVQSLTPQPALPSQFNHLVRGGGRHVVGSVTESDGIGGTATRSYKYTNLWTNTTGRGSLGFRRIERTGGPSGASASQSATTYRQDFPYTGLPVADATCQPTGSCAVDSGSRISTNTTEWTSQSSQLGTDPKYYAVRVFRSASEEYDDDGATVLRTTRRDLSQATDWDYDRGAPVQEQVTVQAGSSGDVWTTVRDYQYPLSPGVTEWCRQQPSQVTETRTNPGELSESRVVRFDYYSACKLYHQYLGGSGSHTELKVELTYNAYGNLTKRTESSGDGLSSQRVTNFTPSTDQYRVSRETKVIVAEQTDNCGTILTPATDLRTDFEWDDRLGLRKKETTPQGIITAWTFDAFGRVSDIDEVTRGVHTDVTYSPCSNSSCFPGNGVTYRVRANRTSDGYYSDVYFDALDRQVGESFALLGGLESRQATRFNALGQVIERDSPYSADPNLGASTTSAVMSYEYDAVGRITKEIRPIGGNVTSQGPNEVVYAYDGLATTVTDAEGRKRRLEYNANGTLKEVREDPQITNATTTYTYTAFGEIQSIEDAGAVVNGNTVRATTLFAYNDRGFLGERSDADRGEWIFAHNAWGDLETQTHPKGKQKFSYDPVGRLLSREDATPGNATVLTTTWTYFGNDGANTGQLEKVETGGYHKQQFSYHPSGVSRGLLAQTKVSFPTWPGSPDFDTDYSYDALGRLDTMTYPTAGEAGRLQVKYSYDTSTGYLLSACQASAGSCLNPIYTAGTSNGSLISAMDAVGNYERGFFGTSANPTLEFRVADPTNWRQSEIVLVLPGGAQSWLKYGWDHAGNLTDRDRHNATPVESFEYDALNRLKTVKLDTGGTLTTTMSLDYYPNGNIQSKTGPAGSSVGTYRYGTTGGGPHAVSQIEGNRGGTFHYDAAGNLNCSSWSNGACNAGASTLWSTFNMPTRIEHGSTSNYVDFAYGPNRERVRTTEHDGSDSRWIYHVGPHFEVENANGVGGYGYRYRSIVYFGNRMVYARVDDETQGASQAVQEGYLHLDYQGSLIKVVDVASTIPSAFKLNYSFDAFGKRRFPDQWTNDSNDTLFAENQWLEAGYTGHAHLDSARLIHMRGRVQNPIWGRMLSPDPVLGDFSDPQTLNPYSYVSNRPMTFTDPSGLAQRVEERLQSGMDCAGRCTVYSMTTADLTITKWFDGDRLLDFDIRIDAIHERRYSADEFDHQSSRNHSSERITESVLRKNWRFVFSAATKRTFSAGHRIAIAMRGNAFPPTATWIALISARPLEADGTRQAIAAGDDWLKPIQYTAMTGQLFGVDSALRLVLDAGGGAAGWEWSIDVPPQAETHENAGWRQVEVYVPR